MKTIKIEGGIYVDSRDPLSEPQLYSFFRGEAKTWNTYVLVMPHTIEVELPDDFDPRADMVRALEEQKKTLQAEFANRVTEINRQIQSLLAITNEVPA